MDFSNIKLVVSDMDGTLLNSNHEVSPQFLELFKGLKEKGIQFVAASGRQYNSIVDKLEAIKDDIIIVAENGAYAVHQDQELFSVSLDQNLRNNMLDTLAPVEDIYPVLCGKRNAYITETGQVFKDVLAQYYTAFTVVPDLKDTQDETLKIAIYHFDSSEKYIYPHVRSFEGKAQVKVSGTNWVDLSSSTAHKGNALEKLQQKLGITPEQTMVFGDYNNDLEMMELSHYSFAMANAHPNVLKKARYATSSNDDLGVERVLERLLS